MPRILRVGPEVYQLPDDVRLARLLDWADKISDLAPNIYSVKAYGARGDGVHDDTAAIQAAVDAAQAQAAPYGAPRACVYFPPGRYIISDSIYVTGGIAIIGESRESVSISPADGQQLLRPAFIVGPTYDEPWLTDPLVGETGKSLQTFYSYGSGGANLDGHPVYALRETISTLNLHGLAELNVRGFIRLDSHDANGERRTIWNSFGKLKSLGTDAKSAFALQLLGDGDSTNLFVLRLVTSNGTVDKVVAIPDGGLELDTVYHVEMDWDGSHLRLFLDGEMLAEEEASGTLVQDPCEELSFGGPRLSGLGYTLIDNGSFTGALFSPQLSDVSRHVEAFVPPTEAHEADANTLFLFNGERARHNWLVAETKLGKQVFAQWSIPSPASDGGATRIADLSFYVVANPIIASRSPRMLVEDVFAHNCRTGVVFRQDCFNSIVRRLWIQATLGDSRYALALLSTCHGTWIQDCILEYAAYELVVGQTTTVHVVGSYLTQGKFQLVANASTLAFSATWFSNEGSEMSPEACVWLGAGTVATFTGCNFEMSFEAPDLLLGTDGNSHVVATLTGCFFSGEGVGVHNAPGAAWEKLRVAAYNNTHLEDAPILPEGLGNAAGAGLTGISATATPAQNLRGALTISDSGTTGAVTFDVEEPDDSYHVAVTPVSSTGTPDTGSNRVLSVTKTSAGFTVEVEAAPGSGNSVTFDWILVR